MMVMLKRISKFNKNSILTDFRSVSEMTLF